MPTDDESHRDDDSPTFAPNDTSWLMDVQFSKRTVEYRVSVERRRGQAAPRDLDVAGHKVSNFCG